MPNNHAARLLFFSEFVPPTRLFWHYITVHKNTCTLINFHAHYTLILTLTKILQRFLENLLFLGWQHWQKREKTRNPWNLIWNFNYSHHWKKYALQNESIKRIFTLTHSLNLSMRTYLPFMHWGLCKATINHLLHATIR